VTEHNNNVVTELLLLLLLLLLMMIMMMMMTTLRAKCIRTNFTTGRPGTAAHKPTVVDFEIHVYMASSEFV